MSIGQGIILILFIIPSFMYVLFAKLDDMYSHSSKRFVTNQRRKSRERREKIEEAIYKRELRGEI